jgi:hypothetical protein
MSLCLYLAVLEGGVGGVLTLEDLMNYGDDCGDDDERIGSCNFAHRCIFRDCREAES